MGNVVDAILDAAERRIRLGGYGGFSFREIAADVGIRSSSVHYYFSTKEKLGAALIRRYTDVVSAKVDAKIAEGLAPSIAMTETFRATAVSDARMCPSTVFGAEALSLPEEVAIEVRRFFEMCLAKLTPTSKSLDEATRHLSSLIGALVLANAMGNGLVYDQATQSSGTRDDELRDCAI